ncbi:MAG: homocysteine S-methyltransferase [Gemmatimonadota bacterium]|jgi:homocysteine S-methyltransferase
MNPLAPLFERQRVVVLDGGLATALEALGHDLDHALWSARLLVEAPEAIASVTRSYLAAGADCVSTATYQATFEGFRDAGVDDRAAEGLFGRAVDVAVAVRDDFWTDPENRAGRLRPLVAASIGPYGAYLADGSEYSGRYGLDQRSLRRFHARRFELLADSEADLLALETIPSLPEARALLDLLAARPGVWAWISFCCGDDAHLWDGSPLEDAVRACEAIEGVAAIGVNCVRPALAEALVERIAGVTERPIAVYPNSGEAWDAERKRWRPSDETVDWLVDPARWARAGATVVGGCCRVGPDQIRRARAGLLTPPG